jgi:hypothetical protein
MDSSVGTAHGHNSLRIGELEGSGHFSAVSKVTTNKSGALFVHIQVQAGDDPDDNVSLVVSMLAINRNDFKRRELSHTMSFVIPTTALSRNRSGDFAPMLSFANNSDITAADPSIAIALDEEELAEIFMPAGSNNSLTMSELKAGMSLESSAIGVRMRQSGNLASNRRKWGGSRYNNHPLLDDSGDGRSGTVFQGLAGGRGGCHRMRLSVFR